MPELPEVETTRRGITRHIENMRVNNVVIRQRQLRWPIPKGLKQKLNGQELQQVSRRGKYLLLSFARGTLLLHLGMSGSLRIVNTNSTPDKHDHFDLCFSSGKCLRLRDPRRFGAVLWTSEEPLQHELLKKLGPEPLSKEFTGEYLYQRSRKRSCSIKQFIMNSHIVVGVGNIYASESLFYAGIRPTVKAGKISKARYQQLANAIKDVLNKAIACGGTTLQDFTSTDGKPGYFQQQLAVYGRKDESCPKCGGTIKMIQQQNRASYYCSHCQH